MADDMRDFREDEVCGCQGDGRCRSRDAEDSSSINNPGSRPGQHRCRADLLDALHPEEFPEPLNPLLQQGRDRFNGTVIVGETCPPVDNDAVRFFYRNEQFIPDRINAIGNDSVVPDGDGRLFKESGNGLSAGIGINGPGCRDGDDSPGDLERSDVIMAHGR